MDSILFLAGGLIFSNVTITALLFYEIKQVEGLLSQFLNGIEITEEKTESKDPGTHTFR